MLHYTLGKPGTALPDFAPLSAPRHDSRSAPAVPIDLKRVALTGTPSLNDLIPRQIQHERAADTKREKTAERKPVSVPSGQACARTDAMGLVNLPDGKR